MLPVTLLKLPQIVSHYHEPFTCKSVCSMLASVDHILFIPKNKA